MTQMNLPRKQKHVHRHRKRLLVAKGKGDGGGMDWEFGTSRCKLVHIEWVKKVLLYSIGNYIQYPVINHNGKEYEKYICITRSLCYTV